MNIAKLQRQDPRMVLSLRYRQGRNWTGAKYFSQTAKATKHTTPTTIIAIMLPLAHLSLDDVARLIGRRTRENAAVINNIPRTNWLLAGLPHNVMVLPTVELDYVVLNGLCPCTSRVAFRCRTHANSFTVVQEKADCNWYCDNWKNDAEHTKCPAEIVFL